jgi:hypothetical protein
VLYYCIQEKDGLVKLEEKSRPFNFNNRLIVGMLKLLTKNLADIFINNNNKKLRKDQHKK